MARGQHRIYLGAAPGVGKTYAMLQEGQRRLERGGDVVIGIVETHGRSNTLSQVGDLPTVPRRIVLYRGASIEEMDVDAIISRAPSVVLVDELAHTNAPGSAHQKRWQDVDQLLDAGIDVISTVNIQHLESLNDVVERITGARQQEIIPDSIVRAADQVQLVDQTPEALRRRMSHGNIYAPDRVDAALANYFRVGNLSALRELALMWVADQVDEGLQQYRERHGIDSTWETRERVVIAMTGAPNGDVLIRRAARIAARMRGELFGVHVRSIDGLSAGADSRIDEQRRLLLALGGEYHELASGDVAKALVQQARAVGGTQIVLGESRRSRWQELTQGSVINDVNRHSGDIDIHIISTSATEGESANPIGAKHLVSDFVDFRTVLSPRRRQMAWVLSLAVPTLICLLLSVTRNQLTLPSQLLTFLLGVVFVATVGGFRPAMAAAVYSFGLENWFFTPPLYTLTVKDSENLFSLFVFLGTAAAVGFFVSSAARRSADAARSQGEAQTLAALAATVTADVDPMTSIVTQLQDTFPSVGASVLSRRGDGWSVEAAAGTEPPLSPDTADRVAELSADVVVALGRCEHDIDDDLFRIFAGQLSTVVERIRLQSAARRVDEMSKADELRVALLAAVSHDLRTPLASIKAAASTLRQEDVDWPLDVQREFLETIEDQTDRLTRLVSNLLDMSRVQAGVVELAARPVGADEVVSAAVASVADIGGVIENQVATDLRPMNVDPALAERVIANLISNAVKWSPADEPVRVSATMHADRVVISIADHGPGIPERRRAEVFQPFQRLGDGTVGGLGLGLAVAHGLTTLMGGDVEIGDTPGGGTTMIVSFPAADIVAGDLVPIESTMRPARQP